MSKKTPQNYGTADNPVRISGIRYLLACARKIFLPMTVHVDDESNEAADTGTVVGKAIEEWHKCGDIRAALDAAFEYGNTNADKYKTTAIRPTLEGYASDPRNAPMDRVPSDSTVGAVLNASLEMLVEFTLPPHESDPTGLPILFRGHLDQARRDYDGMIRVWDNKHSGRDGGIVLLNKYGIQLVGYALGLAAMLNEPVGIGGIIRSTDYLKKSDPKPAFYHSGLEFEDCIRLMKPVQRAVADVRRGDPDPVSNDLCSWCVGGPHVCLHPDTLPSLETSAT